MTKHVTVLTTFEVDDEVSARALESIAGAMIAQVVDALDAHDEPIETRAVKSVDAYCSEPKALELLLKAAGVTLEGLEPDDCGYDEATIQAAWELLRDLTREV